MTQTNDPPTVLDIGLIPNSNEKADLNAPSDSGGKLVVSQAPNITITETNVVADADERLALDVQEGDIAIQTNVSTSFIFTGGDNIATNWETLDFDAVGAIDGEDINPSGISGANINTAAAGEALTSDGSGSLQFASVGGIEEASTFDDLPTPDPPQIGYVITEEEYYKSTPRLGSPFDIDQINETQSISNFKSSLESLHWKNDGTRLYVASAVDDEVEQFDLSTPFDISTTTAAGAFPSGDLTYGIALNNSGTKMFTADFSLNTIDQYDLSNPFDVTSATFDTQIDSQDNNLQDLNFNDDGSKMYECGDDSGGKIYQYSLNTPFDIDTATLETTINAQDNEITDIAFNNDGSKMYECGDQTNDIIQFTLSTPFDVGSRSLDKSVSIPQFPEAIEWDDNGNNLYVSDAFDNLTQLSVFTGGWETF